MASELKTNYGGASFTKNGVSFIQPAVAFTKDVTGDRGLRAVQVIGTTEEQVGLGELGSIGYFYLHNLDATNYIEFGSATGAYALKIPPGGFAEGFWSGAAIYAKANTAACKLEYFVVEV